jgi:acetyltransferase
VALKALVEAPRAAGELDAVLIGLDGEAALRSGWAELERRIAAAGVPWLGAAVQPLAPAGTDVLLGVVADPELGPVLALGTGGRTAGLGSQVAFRLTPVRDVDLGALADDVPAVSAWLDGERGGTPLDRVALLDVAARLALLATAVPRLAECDLNSVRVSAGGAVVLDARLRLARPPAHERSRAW